MITQNIELTVFNQRIRDPRTEKTRNKELYQTRSGKNRKISEQFGPIDRSSLAGPRVSARASLHRVENNERTNPLCTLRDKITIGLCILFFFILFCSIILLGIFFFMKFKKDEFIPEQPDYFDWSV